MPERFPRRSSLVGPLAAHQAKRDGRLSTTPISAHSNCDLVLRVILLDGHAACLVPLGLGHQTKARTKGLHGVRLEGVH